MLKSHKIDQPYSHISAEHILSPSSLVSFRLVTVDGMSSSYTLLNMDSPLHNL